MWKNRNKEFACEMADLELKEEEEQKAWEVEDQRLLEEEEEE